MVKAEAPPIAPCKLCSKVGTLTDSHIIPQFAYRRVTQMASPTEKNKTPVQVGEGIAMFKADQLSEYLLCRACEEMFGGWEKYVAGVTWKDGAFPLLDAALAHLIVGGPDDFRPARLAECSDIEAISKFGTSVLWRSAACPDLMKNAICLGPHFDRFREYLLGEAPFPENARLVLQIVNSDEVSAALHARHDAGTE
jgi:hypothetical protein